MNIVHFNHARMSKRKPPTPLRTFGLSDQISRIDRDIRWKLSSMREDAGLSRMELARLSGCTPHEIATYETGENKISANKLKVIAELLKCDISEFLEELAGPMYRSGTEYAQIAKQLDKIKDDEIKDCLNHLIHLIAARVA